MVGRVGRNGRVRGGTWDVMAGRVCVQECMGDSAYTSGVWTHARGLARVDVLSSFVHNVMMDAWQEDQVRRMNVHVPLAPGHCHAHAASVAQRQRATHRAEMGSERMGRGQDGRGAAKSGLWGADGAQ